MDFLIDYDFIRRITRETLGQTSVKHSKSIFIEICLVLLNIKSAYLVDSFSTDVSKLASLVSRVYDYLDQNVAVENDNRATPSTSKCSVRIFEIGDDLMVVNEQHYLMICHMFESRVSLFPISTSPESKETVFIDVSADRKQPSLLDDGMKRELIKWILQTLTNASEIPVHDPGQVNSGPAKCNSDEKPHMIRIQRLHFDSENDCACVPSLFGVLLGYPVVYFLRGDQENCLALAPLKLITVSFRLECGSQHSCISFSVPEQFYRDEILASLRSLQARLKGVFATARVDVQTIIQKSIAL